MQQTLPIIYKKYQSILKVITVAIVLIAITEGEREQVVERIRTIRSPRQQIASISRKR